MTTSPQLKLRFAIAAFDRWKGRRALERFNDAISAYVEHCRIFPSVIQKELVHAHLRDITDKITFPPKDRNHGHPLNPHRQKPKRRKKK